MAEELKVIGAGCGRTGTSSLREALKTLGYNPYHMEECVRNDHFRLWLRAGRGDGAALDAALRGYDATTDFPAATFVDELVRRHPAAKVVLSTRDAGDWARSVRATIWHPTSSRAPLFRCRSENARARVACTASASSAAPSRRSATSTPETPLRAHGSGTRPPVPADRIARPPRDDGWAPLCAFLGKPIPMRLTRAGQRRCVSKAHSPGVPGRVLRRLVVAGGRRYCCGDAICGMNPHVFSMALILLAAKAAARRHRAAPQPPRARLVRLSPPLLLCKNETCSCPIAAILPGTVS